MFNLSKHAQFADMVQDAGEAVETGLTEPEDVSLPQEEVVGDLGPNDAEKQRVLDLTSDQKLLETLNSLQGKYPAEFEAVNSFLTNSNAFRQLQAEIGGLEDLTEQYDMQAMAPQVDTFSEHQLDETEVLNTLRRLNAIRREQENNQVPLAAFNLHRHKIAQMGQPMPQEMPMQQPDMMQQEMPQPPMPEEVSEEPFPVANEGDFITKFLDDLLAFDNQPGSPDYDRARIAAETIREAVSPGFEEEANSIIESVMQLDENSRDQAASHLIKLYEVLIPPMLKDVEEQVDQPMEPVMSQNDTDDVKGILRFSLTEHVLNNSQGLTKTAADHFGQQYVLYGPTEKRICPKLSGKNMGDVVSEFTCRHYCIDGIAIDDNKTICGEALWRSSVLDKYSREYVNAEGETEGGYLNKRFETNRNVPEENKARLKPGETRKPRPASQGNTESRLQDMRAKEGQNRDYRPETNTGDPFEWCHDVDQNNVEVSQAERDRRQEAAGNKLVQYTNRDQGENSPKRAFNLKMHKEAQESFGGPAAPEVESRWDQRRQNVGTGQLPEGWSPQHLEKLSQHFTSLGNMPERASQMALEMAWKASELNANPDEVIQQYSAQSAQRSELDNTHPDDRGRPQSPVTWQNQGGEYYASKNKDHKTAQAPGESPSITMVRTPRKKNPRDTYNTEINPAAVPGMPQPSKDVDMSHSGLDGGKPMKKKQSGFNLNQYKEAMSSKDIKDRGVKDVYIEELLKSKPEDKSASSKKKT